MDEKIIDVKLKIFNAAKKCPSGHLTRYAVLVGDKQACSVCLSQGLCDEWFD